MSASGRPLRETGSLKHREKKRVPHLGVIFIGQTFGVITRRIFIPMKTQTILTLAATLLGGVATGLHAEGIATKQCPEPVWRTIRDHLGKGRLDEVKTFSKDGRVLYHAEIELPGNRERMLHVGDDGTLLKLIEAIRLRELPRPVQSALDPFLANSTRFDGADRVLAGGKTEYHLDLELVDDVDLHLVLGERGEVLRHREEADF